VTSLPHHAVAWIAPPPLRAPGAGTGAAPALLRFASDEFIPQLIAMLAEDPARLRGVVARPETWRGPSPAPQPAAPRPAVPLSPAAERLRRFVGLRRAAPAPAIAAAEETRPLKLYQPVQQRHYLVAAALVCRMPGLPDRTIDAGKAERAGFVLRRLLPPGTPDPKQPVPRFDPATWQEHAFLPPAAGGPAWLPLADPARELAPGEEVPPLFPLAYEEDDGRQRRLLAGVVPAGQREAYMAAPRGTPAGGGASAPGPLPRTGRYLHLRSQVIEPWKRLIEGAHQAESRLDAPVNADGTPNEDKRAANEAQRNIQRDQIQTVSWYVLLDLLEFLDQHLPDLMAAVMASTPPGDAALRALYDGLGAVTIPATLRGVVGTGDYASTDVRQNLREALAAIAGGRPRDPGREKAVRDGLEAVATPFRRTGRAQGWPDFLFPLAEPSTASGMQPGFPPATRLTEADGVDAWLLHGEAEPRPDQHEGVETIAALVTRALPLAAPAGGPALPLAAQPPLDPAAEGWFAIRCVLERPGCSPLHPPALSERTEPFILAGFFDSDAPARPVRIGLPADISPAGLRKFDKNAVVMLSDALCGQIHRARGMGLGDLVRSVLPFPLHKDLDAGGGEPCTAADSPGLSLGLMCSLSIPIITLCALILLIIMVSLLDLIFRWLPFFVTCLPVPGFSAKGRR
jgi:hypothetical protein